jgi:hypothetical protein
MLKLSQRRTILILMVAGLALIGVGILLAQEVTQAPECDLATEYADLSAQLADIDIEADPQAALAMLYQVGLAAQELATRCGYTLTDEQKAALADFVLTQVDLRTIIARNAIGTDVEKILAKLAETPADPVIGQLLYNSVEAAADGTTLGCAGCHEVGGEAPPTEGTWTRFDEIRSQDPVLAGYSFEQYMVESIVLPNQYIVPDYVPNLMPDHFGTRLTIEQLADIVAFLGSQDQEIE